jgi:hypothetical protein
VFVLSSVVLPCDFVLSCGCLVFWLSCLGHFLSCEGTNYAPEDNARFKHVGGRSALCPLPRVRLDNTYLKIDIFKNRIFEKMFLNIVTNGKSMWQCMQKTKRWA